MKVLLAHNYYQQPGGEDRVFSDEARMLAAYGHEVIRYCHHNDEIRDMSVLRTVVNSLWNTSTYRELRSLLERERPAVCHFHNTFPLMSPAALHAARDAGIPIVVTLHNYRLVCANALFMRSGHACEDCQGRLIPLPAVIHRCYRNDRGASAVSMLTMTAQRHVFGTLDLVNVFIALTEFSRQKFIEGGLPAHKIRVKPNFVHPDPGYSRNPNGDVLFAGRLSTEKGIQILLDAWRLIPGDARLRIIGTGPLAPEVQAACSRDSRIHWLGQLPHEVVLREMKTASLLVFPSIWYESFGLCLVEAFATGLPVLASDMGTMRHLIQEGGTGLKFTPGDPAALAKGVQAALSNPEGLEILGREARKEFETMYTQATNYRQLIGIYDAACGDAAEAGVRPPGYLASMEKTA